MTAYAGGILCCAKGCGVELPPTSRSAFCTFHWNLLPKPLQTEWHHRDRSAPEKPLLNRMTAAIETAQFGARLL